MQKIVKNCIVLKRNHSSQSADFMHQMKMPDMK